jgi:hypothetical protein
MPESSPRLYAELAAWFHLLTAPEEYADEAELYLRTFAEAAGAPPRTLLELGSGGGNVASHYKRQVASTLVDLSPRCSPSAGASIPNASISGGICGRCVSAGRSTPCWCTTR